MAHCIKAHCGRICPAQKKIQNQTSRCNHMGNGSSAKLFPDHKKHKGLQKGLPIRQDSLLRPAADCRLSAIFKFEKELL